MHLPELRRSGLFRPTHARAFDWWRSLRSVERWLFLATNLLPKAVWTVGEHRMSNKEFSMRKSGTCANKQFNIRDSLFVFDIEFR
ncbi:hypothetical protein LF1_31780 [Rubripirellula obstinata]|uniref:Uncharacterized protein n=1 Tax=Rubripirellula obstinata TaxID=406547 RepID=A0A5B1CHG8_9BACT|nr:hypothetical protein LF1_31780 [Rubripirellula obstinata]